VVKRATDADLTEKQGSPKRQMKNSDVGPEGVPAAHSVASGSTDDCPTSASDVTDVRHVLSGAAAAPEDAETLEFLLSNVMEGTETPNGLSDGAAAPAEAMEAAETLQYC
jgi:hypothetical protein